MHLTICIIYLLHSLHCTQDTNLLYIIFNWSNAVGRSWLRRKFLDHNNTTKSGPNKYTAINVLQLKYAHPVQKFQNTPTVRINAIAVAVGAGKTTPTTGSQYYGANRPLNSWSTIKWSSNTRPLPPHCSKMVEGGEHTMHMPLWDWRHWYLSVLCTPVMAGQGSGR